MDTLSPEQRRKAMLGNKSKGTKPEDAMARVLQVAGLPFKRNQRVEWGRGSKKRSIEVDFLIGSRIVVEVYGCFWHGCLKHSSLPKSNAAYWLPKLARNQARDRLNRDRLRRDGYFVRFVWEHDVVRGGTATLHKRVREVAEEWRRTA